MAISSWVWQCRLTLPKPALASMLASISPLDDIELGSAVQVDTAEANNGVNAGFDIALDLGVGDTGPSFTDYYPLRRNYTAQRQPCRAHTEFTVSSNKSKTFVASKRNRIIYLGCCEFPILATANDRNVALGLSELQRFIFLREQGFGLFWNVPLIWSLELEKKKNYSFKAVGLRHYLCIQSPYMAYGGQQCGHKVMHNGHINIGT